MRGTILLAAVLAVMPVFAGVSGNASLVDLVKADNQQAAIALIDQHVNAIRAVVREYARPDLLDAATALTKRLREVTDEFLKTENSFRPDYLENIFAPPLVPGA